MEAMPHRGPDAKGIHERSDAVSGHTRLSIVDGKKGRQPILADAGRAGIICNGEIYNFRSLQSELDGAYRFTTDSDSEAALHLCREKGPAFTGRLVVMFALAAFKGNEYILARVSVVIWMGFDFEEERKPVRGTIDRNPNMT